MTTPAATPQINRKKARRNIHVRGIVQGVGFRPFVYKLAKSRNLTGFVFNTSSGVTIEIEGDAEGINDFVAHLKTDAPLLANITELTHSELPPQNSTDFIIRASREEPGEFALISPDAGTCDACWRDFGDPANRRFGYPFTNCTHCGPRYTIIEDIPYDRPNTTMTAIHHVRGLPQRNTKTLSTAASTPSPTPALFAGRRCVCIPGGSSIADCVFTERDPFRAIQKARRLLREGKILAVKGLGGFLLACDAQQRSRRSPNCANASGVRQSPSP